IITLGDLFDNEETQTDVLFPFINLTLASRLIEEILPDYKIKKSMNQLPKKSMLLTLIKPSYFFLILVVLTYYFYVDFCFIPLIKLTLTLRLIEEILPDYKIKKSMNQLPKKSMLLTLIKPSYFFLILVVLTYYFYPEFWFIPLIYLFFIMIKRIIEHFNSKYLISDEF